MRDDVDASVTKAEANDIDSPELERQISRLVFAGYVSMIDRWLLKLLEAVESSDEQILFVVSANQGHSFGETLGLLPDSGSAMPMFDADDRASESNLPGSLSDAEVRTPLLMAEFSRTGGKSFGRRLSTLVQPVDLAATLKDWFGGIASQGGNGSVGRNLSQALNGGTPDGRPAALYLGADGKLGVRNQNWAMVTSAEALQDEELVHSEVRLFAKPDDQWDVNDVASQYRKEVDQLRDQLRERNPGDH